MIFDFILPAINHYMYSCTLGGDFFSRQSSCPIVCQDENFIEYIILQTEKNYMRELKYKLKKIKEVERERDVNEITR